MRDVVATWFGAFVLDGQEVVASYPFPADRSQLLDRLRMRRDGHLAPEETRLVAEHVARGLRSRDRRFVQAGAKPGSGEIPELDPGAYGFDPSWHRELLLDHAEEALRSAWDSSIHIEEAVKALRDLDATRNLLGERLGSWGSRDAPATEEGAGSTDAAARRLATETEDRADDIARPAASLGEARRGLAQLYLSLGAVSTTLEKSLEEQVPREAPNVSSLLGPLLAARLIAQAGGLDRLAKLPASTIQVLGAERAFFEHLRGHAPPPRHGLLFLHPDIQGAPRGSRGKLARALAGKVAIAARLDREGRPLRPDLVSGFQHRTEEVRALGPRRRPTGARRRSRPPLHRASAHR